MKKYKMLFFVIASGFLVLLALIPRNAFEHGTQDAFSDSAEDSSASVGMPLNKPNDSVGPSPEANDQGKLRSSEPDRLADLISTEAIARQKIIANEIIPPSKEHVVQRTAEIEMSDLISRRVNEALNRKYRRRPELRGMDSELDFDITDLSKPKVSVETMVKFYHRAPCERCLKVTFYLRRPNRPGDGWAGETHRVLSCPFTISLAGFEGDDAVLFDDIEHNACFEPLSVEHDREQKNGSTSLPDADGQPPSS